MEFIETPVCPVCGSSTVMFVDEIAYERWQSREILIQQAFPDMSLGERELIKTGFHPACWDSLFTEEES
jgi:hypothetical protein